MHDRRLSAQDCSREDRQLQKQKGGMCHPSHECGAHPNLLEQRWDF